MLDSTIVIDLSKQRPEAIAFVGRRPGRSFYLHPASAAEILVGAKNRSDLRRLDDLLSRFRSAEPSTDDFDHCLSFVRRYHLTHNVDWPDCLIAAAAMRLDVPVVTLNDKHFRCIRGLRVVRPY